MTVESMAPAASAILWSASLIWLLGTVICALLQPGKRRIAPVGGTPASASVAVSVVVPTSAVDTPETAQDRADTLQSFLSVDYRNVDVVVSVDRAEEGKALTADLMRTYAAEPVRIVAAHRQAHPNAKVDAMEAGMEAARHDLVLFADDDALVDREHIANMVRRYQADGGLVSAAAVGILPQNLAAWFELAFMNGQFARLHLAGDVLGFSGALGKAVLVTRQDLARSGGLPGIGGDCCEDAALTRNFKAQGLRVALSESPVRQPIRRQRFLDVLRRHRRWLSCRRKYLPVVFVCEALFSAPVAIAAACIAAGAFLGQATAGAVVTALIWCAVDSLFYLLKGWPWSGWTPVAWLLREAAFLPVWLSALFARTVTWYGRRVPVSVEGA
jgi:ceramide glucosyltransferase